MFSLFKKRSIAPEAEKPRNSSLLNDYFTLAIYAFVYCDDEAAGIAARSTGFLMDARQRAGMAAFLQELALQDSRNAEIPERLRGLWMSKLITLAGELAATEWSKADGMAAQRELKEMAPVYLQAQRKCDPAVFVVVHPELRMI